MAKEKLVEVILRKNRGNLFAGEHTAFPPAVAAQMVKDGLVFYVEDPKPVTKPREKKVDKAPVDKQVKAPEKKK